MLPKFLIRGIFYVLVGWYALWINPFGIYDKSDLATQDAVYRLIAPFYDSAARDNILVILLTEDAIRDLYDWQVIAANEWPIRYADHGYLLGRIMAFKPRAVFVDVYFRQERSTDDSFRRMQAVLERFSKHYPVSLYFAGNFPGMSNSPIQKRLMEVGTLTINGWDGFGRAYPLKIGDAFTSAYLLYREACLGSEPYYSCHKKRLHEVSVKSGHALSIYWGSREPRPLFPEYRHRQTPCIGSEGVGWTLWGMARNLWHGLLGNMAETRERCVYHQTLFANELIGILKQGSPQQKTRLKKVIQDRIVFYGVALDGLHDVVSTPVHGQLPGIYLHAMALDNLISLGGNYIHASDDFIEYLSMGLWAGLALTFAWSVCRLEQRAPETYAKSAKTNPCAVSFEMLRHPVRWLRESSRSHPKTTLFLLGSLVVVLICGMLFVVLHYEPVNSVAFIGLLGTIALVRDSRLETAFVERFQCLQKWVRKVFGFRRRVDVRDDGESEL
ncbi:MAG TPA: CHASE2 domain-containing protein [Gammaproteobacteria bacterium]|nr:CHASE2 domain-containing protein [Gammaproteobacteria bacterium]